jgi:hypothetical protein
MKHLDLLIALLDLANTLAKLLLIAFGAGESAQLKMTSARISDPSQYKSIQKITTQMSL